MLVFVTYAKRVSGGAVLNDYFNATLRLRSSLLTEDGFNEAITSISKRHDWPISYPVITFFKEARECIPTDAERSEIDSKDEPHGTKVPIKRVADFYNSSDELWGFIIGAICVLALIPFNSRSLYYSEDYLIPLSIFVLAIVSFGYGSRQVYKSSKEWLIAQDRYTSEFLDQLDVRSLWRITISPDFSRVDKRCAERLLHKKYPGFSAEEASI